MNIFDIEVKKIDGTQKSLKDFEGKVLLIVNTATKCGFTPQYENLKELYNNYSSKGFEVLDFPCNQFGEQAPGTNEEITEFCTLNYNTPYEIFAKTDVNGENECELFKYLKSQKTFEGFNNKDHNLTAILHEMMSKKDPDYAQKSDIKWNFTKFLVNRNGEVVRRFEPVDDLDEVEKAIVELL